jgi:hypothetical protein
MSDNSGFDERRRSFLGLAAGNAALATIAVVAGEGSAQAALQQEQEEREQHGYRETEHIRRYYGLARY